MSPKNINPENMAEYEAEINGCGKSIVVVDFFAEWCGPCKMISPKLGELESLGDVGILKLDVDDCSEVAMALDIKAMPTFFIYKNGKKVTDFTGANIDKLKELVQQQIA